MQSASLISVSQNSIVRTTDDAREKLHAALTMLDDLAPKTELPSHSGVTEAYVRALLKSEKPVQSLPGRSVCGPRVGHSPGAICCGVGATPNGSHKPLSAFRRTKHNCTAVDQHIRKERPSYPV